jgi:hypothetical protein
MYSIHPYFIYGIIFHAIYHILIYLMGNPCKQLQDVSLDTFDHQLCVQKGNASATASRCISCQQYQCSQPHLCKLTRYSNKNRICISNSLYQNSINPIFLFFSHSNAFSPISVGGLLN